MATGWTRAKALATEIQDATGITCTTDARSAVPPCLLIIPPTRTYDVACGWDAEWTLILLSSGAGSDAWEQLDDMLDQVEQKVDLDSATPGAYALTNGGDPLPAYTLKATEAVT